MRDQPDRLASRENDQAQPTGMPTDWRSIPMPPQIAALPRTKSGIPITYTVAWTSERGVELRHDPLLEPFMGRKTLATFAAGKQGEGAPKLGVTDVARAREVAVRGLCQVCGRLLPGRPLQPWYSSPRWLAAIRRDGLVIDGWTCRSCLAYALQVCPALVARKHAGDFKLLRVRRAQFVATFEAPDGIPLPVGSRLPVGFVKIQPLDFDEVEPAAFLRDQVLA